jgi:hypothetical protein
MAEPSANTAIPTPSTATRTPAATIPTGHRAGRRRGTRCGSEGFRVARPARAQGGPRKSSGRWSQPKAVDLDARQTPVEVRAGLVGERVESLGRQSLKRLTYQRRANPLSAVFAGDDEHVDDPVDRAIRSYLDCDNDAARPARDKSCHAGGQRYGNGVSACPK